MGDKELEEKTEMDEVLDEAAKAAKDKEEADKAVEAKRAADHKDEPAKPAVDPSKDPQVREQIRRVRGWTEAQLDVELRVAPIQERAARFEIRDKYKDFERYAPAFEKEVEKYAIFDRTPALLEQILWMVKGKHISENPEEPKKKEEPNDVVARRIHSPYPSSSSGDRSDSGNKGTKLTEDEKRYAQFLGVEEEKYEKAKKGDERGDPRLIRRAPEYKAPQGGNSADQALGVLLRPRH